jgi:Tol biopolymer transport system component
MVVRFCSRTGALSVAVVVVFAGVGSRAAAAVSSSVVGPVSFEHTSSGASISGDGSLVAFVHQQVAHTSFDDFRKDILVRDVPSGAMESVNLDMLGVHADATEPEISADGRYVAFTSRAKNLVPDDTNRTFDVFVRDRRTGTTVRASVNNNGDEVDGPSSQPAISGDGRYVAFVSEGPNLPDAGSTTGSAVRQVYLRDMVAGTTVRVSSDATDPATGGNDMSLVPQISHDGRFVAYVSYADNLMTTPDTNGFADVYWWDRLGWGPPMRVSVAGANTEGNADSFGPSISANGRYVVFQSRASNFGGSGAQVYVRDVTTRRTELVSRSSQGFPANDDSVASSISGDGRFVAFQSEATNLVGNDTNGHVDVFVRDRVVNTTVRVSATGTGGQTTIPSYGPRISHDGTHVVYTSGSNLSPGPDIGELTTNVYIVALEDPSGQGFPLRQRTAVSTVST